MAKPPSAQDTEVRDHLEHVLASPAFRNSHRASAMLRYVVENTLAGKSDTLKERTIGSEVFDRPAGYDTASDHIVRSTAGDVRRRLAQYYQENPTGLRIALPAGSYIPAIGTEAHPHHHESPLDRFWKPFLESGRPILLCVGAPGLAPVLAEELPGTPKEQLTLAEVFRLESEKVAFSDAATLATLAGFLSARGAEFRVVRESAISLDDLRHSPTVLIGALNNDWGLRLTNQLRYTFRTEPAAQTSHIMDRAEPAWSIRFDIPFAAVSEDRGLVTRVTDHATGQPMVIAGGVTMLGTLAAATLLTTPDFLPEADWERPNLQLLFATTVLRGSPAPPRVLDLWFW